MTPEGNERNGIVARAEVESLERRVEDHMREDTAYHGMLYGRLCDMEKQVAEMNGKLLKMMGGLSVGTALLVILAEWLLKL